MHALVGFTDPTFHKSALCSGCSFNFHFYIYLFVCIFFPIVFNFVIRIVDLDKPILSFLLYTFIYIYMFIYVYISGHTHSAQISQKQDGRNIYACNWARDV